MKWKWLRSNEKWNVAIQTMAMPRSASSRSKRGDGAAASGIDETQGFRRAAGLAAPARAMGKKRRPAGDDGPQHRRRERPHGDVRECGGDQQPPREAPSPKPLVAREEPALRGRGGRTGRQRVPLGTEQRRQHERRLQRHADALADDRMRLASGVADAKDSVAGAEPHARPDRAGGEPRPVATCALEGAGDALAFAPPDRFDDIARLLARLRLAATPEPIVANAAGERGDAVVGNDHAAVAAGEGQ